MDIGDPDALAWIVAQAENLESAVGSNRPGRWLDERDYARLNANDAVYDTDANRYYDWRLDVCPATFFEAQVDAGGVMAAAPGAVPNLALNPPALYAEEDLFINDRAHVYSATGDPAMVVAGNMVRRLQDESRPRVYGYPPGVPPQDQGEVGLEGEARHTYARIGVETVINGPLVTSGGFLSVGPRALFGGLRIPFSTDVHWGSYQYLPPPSSWQRVPEPDIPRLRVSRGFPTVIANQSSSLVSRPEGLLLPANPNVVYDMIKVDNKVAIILEPGVYFTERLQVEPEGLLGLPCDANYFALHGHCENVTVLVRKSVDVKSPLQTVLLGGGQEPPPAAQSFLLGYFGTQEAFIHYLDMTVVAPRAKVTLFTANPPHRARHHIGSVYAKSVEVHQDSQFEYVPFICDP